MQLFWESYHSSSSSSSQSSSSSSIRFHLLYHARTISHFLVKPFNRFLNVSIRQLAMSIFGSAHQGSRQKE